MRAFRSPLTIKINAKMPPSRFRLVVAVKSSFRFGAADIHGDLGAVMATTPPPIPIEILTWRRGGNVEDEQS